MGFKSQITADESVFLNEEEFAEPARVLTVDGQSLTISIIKAGTSDLAIAEPGYADTDNFTAAKTKYPQPKPGDRITDEDKVEWIVEPGARCVHGLWSVPVKSDRRLRA